MEPAIDFVKITSRNQSHTGNTRSRVFLRHTIHESSLIQGLLLTGKSVLVQEYIAESHGKDIRALVVGDRVVAAMRRKARGEIPQQLSPQRHC